MPRNLSHELGLFRNVIAHLERRPLHFERMTQDFLRKEGIGQAREAQDGIYVIRMPGHLRFNDLTNCILDRLPALERGCYYSDIQDALFTFLIRFSGREPSSIQIEDCESLIGHFIGWFSVRSASTRHFVPCVISPTPAPRFSIGPVTFECLDTVGASDFVPSSTNGDATDRTDFDKLVRWMEKEHSHWLARVTVNECDQKRGKEIAEIATDLAITALQLAAPTMTTRNMSRLNDRRGPSQRKSLSETNGIYAVGWARNEAGISIGQGTMSAILSASTNLIEAIGNVVSSFASGSFRLPTLERAWCDAAYWHHQALAESIDSIAIAKLETSLEVLFISESSKGSEKRLREIIGAFFDLGPDDPIYAGSSVTVRESAKNMVRDRSRILHGTWPTLSARGIDRAGMEGFVASILRKSITRA